MLSLLRATRRLLLLGRVSKPRGRLWRISRISIKLLVLLASNLNVSWPTRRIFDTTRIFLGFDINKFAFFIFVYYGVDIHFESSSRPICFPCISLRSTLRICRLSRNSNDSESEAEHFTLHIQSVTELAFDMRNFIWSFLLLLEHQPPKIYAGFWGQKQRSYVT